MAHSSHAEDTTFIVAEQDFCFRQEDAMVHQMYLSNQEDDACMFIRYDEIADAIDDPVQKEQFLAELAAYKIAAEVDKNAPWPYLPKVEGAATSSSDKQPWQRSIFAMDGRCNVAFSKPGNRRKRMPHPMPFPSICMICKRS